MSKLLLVLFLGCISAPTFAWYYNAVPGITTGLTIGEGNISIQAGTDIWLCSTRGSNRTLVFHIYGLETRDIEVTATFIGMSTSATGTPTLQQCQDATDETASHIKVAQYRLSQSVSVPVQEGDYNVCWSGWDGTGKEARCTAGLPVTPIDDCNSELINYSNDAGTLIAGEAIDRQVKVADLTIRCKTVASTMLEVTQQASADNVLEQKIVDENGVLVEGLRLFRNGLTTPLYMHTTGTPKTAQRIEDSVVVTLNYF